MTGKHYSLCTHFAAAVARGFGLVEVLVALAVGATGLLAAAVVAVEGLRVAGTALRTATAAVLAGDMAERIGANRTAVPHYAGEGPGFNAGCTTTGEDCTSAELAADDWFHWLAAIEAALPPGASATIEAEGGGAPGSCVIEIRWPEPAQAHPARLRLVVP
jgi:type IV pilus assembly protein PilV